jgi:hypothetical protein
MMHRLTKIWTAGIAYVALAIGAGLSIMYNILQTVANRGPLLEPADLVTAVAMPGLVVFAVELFVSRWWVGRAWPVQVIRVASVAYIGGVAMRASWTHGHAWLVGHGQTEDVAIMWPLAIDSLAILATALILAGRRGHVAKPMATDALATPAGWTGPVATAEDVAVSEAAFRGQPDPAATEVATSFWPPSPDALDMAIMAADPVATRPEGELDAWTAGYEKAIDEAGRDLANEAERFVQGTQVPVVPGPLPQRKGPADVPSGVEGYLRAWDPIASGLTGKDVDILLAAYLGRSTRTARRWRSAVLGPVSAPPSS